MTVAEAADVYLPALCVWREMRSGTEPERLGVLWVIKNRAADSLLRWPQQLRNVVLQRLQFSSFNAGDPNAGLFPRPGADFPAWLDICAMCGTPGPDPTGGANHYENLPDGKPKPAWADPRHITKHIGVTRFYRL